MGGGQGTCSLSHSELLIAAERVMRDNCPTSRSHSDGARTQYAKYS